MKHRSARAQIRALILQPIDTTTKEGRSRSRYRRAFATTLAIGCGRLVSSLTLLLSVPLSLGYLGRERFAVWIIISSFSAFLSFADLGIGNGLVHAFSEAN